MKVDYIQCDAHEVVQALPLSADIFACMACGHRGSLQEMFHGKRCKPHLVASTSGWVGEKVTVEFGKAA